MEGWPEPGTSNVYASQIAGPGEAVSADQKNQLAAEVAGLANLVRGGGFVQPIACHFRRTNGPQRDQRHDALEMLPIAPDAGPQGNDVAAVRLWCLGSGADKGRPAAWF